MTQTIQNEQTIKIGNWIAPRLDKLEIILLLVVTISLLIKSATDIPVNLVLIVALGALAVLYFFSSFANINFDNAGRIDVFFHKLASWGCCIGVIGILFWLQDWPGFDLQVLIASITLVIVLPLIVYRKSKNKEIKLFNSRYILRIVLICIVVLSLAFLPYDVLK